MSWDEDQYEMEPHPFIFAGNGIRQLGTRYVEPLPAYRAPPRWSLAILWDETE